MCGIVGLHNPENIIDKNLVEKACDKMSSRGPDNFEISFPSNSICFGHVRLSILDLSNDSNQPFRSPCGNYFITYNGEIYNYKEIKSMLISEGCQFYTSGDTEVLLQLYIKKGIQGLKFLRGMFAFCIYDNVKNTFFLARDICGEKPLFYVKNENIFGFSSTMASLLELDVVPKLLDHHQVYNYLYDGYSQRNSSLIKGINKLQPGSYLKYELKSGSIEIEKYWDIPKFDESYKTDTLEKELIHLLKKSLEEQLFADVPTSVLLSGGLDSSLLTALASDVKDKVQTFSVSFSSDKAYNEIEHANQIANFFNTDHNVLNIEKLSLGSLIEVCDNSDEPLIDSSFIPTYFLAKEVGKHTKVVLGGDGADELFGGYSHYKRLNYLNMIHRNFLPKQLVKLNSKLIQPFENDSNAYKWIDISLQDLLNKVPKTAIYFRKPEKLITGLKKFQNTTTNFHSNKLLSASMEYDFNNFLTSDILVKVDRAMMSASVESRSPFLDKRIIEFSFGNVPIDEKINNKSGKIILQKIAKNLFPSDYQFGRKQGFNFNINKLMAREDVIDYMYNELDIFQLCNREYLEKIIHKNKYSSSYGEKLFGIFNLAFWIKKNNIIWTS